MHEMSRLAMANHNNSCIIQLKYLSHGWRHGGDSSRVDDDDAVAARFRADSARRQQQSGGVKPGAVAEATAQRPQTDREGNSGKDAMEKISYRGSHAKQRQGHEGFCSRRGF
ncbi:hypothetical protein SESBI_33536 [Sesbania bispinosa]|nr:hypothetical protein SESBI_33536 [Sesbania bispinosa]